MFYTIYNLKQDVNANLPGGGINQLTNFFNTFDKGRRAMIGKVRPEELIRTSYLEAALFPDVDKYSVPADMKYDDVIQIMRLSGYRNVDTMEHPLELVYRRRFGQKRGSAANVMNIGYENGIKYARIFRPTSGNRFGEGSNSNNNILYCEYRVIHNCDSLSLNGTWNVGGNVVNLREDRLNHVIGRGSLSFDINGSSTSGFIENFTLTPFSILDFLKRGAEFAWLNLPIARELISVRLIMGSNPDDLTTDLYEASVNSPHDNSEFVVGWNLLKYMLQNLTMVGTPNPTLLTYIRFEFETTGQPIPACNLDNIVLRQGTVFEMTYNSSYIVRDPVTGQWKKIPTENSDIIIAEEDTYELLVDEVTLAAQKESYQASPAAASSIDSVAVRLQAKYKKFMMEHKSEGVLESDSTHVFGNMYDGYSDDTMPGFGNQYGQFGDQGGNLGSFSP